MKTFALALLALSTVALAQAPDSDGISGKWKVHISVSGNENDLDCTMAQKDTGLTGSCTSDRGSVNLTGQVDGKRVSWSYDFDYDGTTLTVKYSGTLDSGKISGDVNVQPYDANGDFTATRTNN